MSASLPFAAMEPTPNARTFRVPASTAIGTVRGLLTYPSFAIAVIYGPNSLRKALFTDFTIILLKSLAITWSGIESFAYDKMSTAAMNSVYIFPPPL